MNTSPSASSSSTHSLTAGIACGVGAGALWGLVFLAPELVSNFSPMELAIGRYVAYGLIAATLIVPRWRVIKNTLTRNDWIALFWLALAGNTLYYILLASAIQLSGIALTSLIIGFLPVAVTIIGSRDHGAVPLSKLWLSLFSCIAGAVCIGWQALTLPATGSLGTQVTGLLCALGALVTWASFAIGNSRALERRQHFSSHDWNLLTGVVTGMQALILVSFAMILQSTAHNSEDLLKFAGVSLAVAVLASIFGNVLWNRMSRLLPLTLVGQMILFETVFALIYGFAWEQRLPTLLEAAAFMCVSVSVISCVHAHRQSGSQRKPSRAKRMLAYFAECLPPANSHPPL